uniref:Ras GTPase-activating protein n=1 Tax=Globodera rostochiensis TaxID=31243 RepID=A0A914IEN6_GLORO
MNGRGAACSLHSSFSTLPLYPQRQQSSVVNERMIGRGDIRDLSPVCKECISTSARSPSSSHSTIVVDHRSGPGSLPHKAVPSSSSSCQPDFLDLPSVTSTSPSSPVSSSPKWRPAPQCSDARTVPKSAMLMSKCQSFLRSSTASIPPSPSIAKRELTKKAGNDQHHPTPQSPATENENDDRIVRNAGEQPEEEKEAVCALSFARKDGTCHVMSGWPHTPTEHCALRVCQDAVEERGAVDEAAPIGMGLKTDEGAKKSIRGEEEEEEEGLGTSPVADMNKQSQLSRNAKRAARPYRRRDRPPPLPPIDPDPKTSVSFSFAPFLHHPSGGCSSSPSTSSPITNATSPLLRNVPTSSPSSQEKDVQLVVAIRMDRREVFRSCPVLLNGNCCVISEEFSMELPRSSIFHSLQLSLFELTEGARVQRCIGRLRLTRHELVAYGNAIQDRWLPIARIRPSEFTETLGAICAELSWNRQRKMLTLRVFDFTIWTLPTNSNSSSHANPLQRHCNGGGRLYLKCRLGFGHSACSTMQKMRLLERRCVEPVRFDCSQFFADKSGHHQHQHQQQQQQQQQQQEASPRSLEDWMSCRSSCATPTSATAAKEHFRFNSRQFKFPPLSSPAQFHQQQQHKVLKTPKGSMLFGEPHLYIKLYGQPNYCEDSLCGFVHIPLESETMQPRETPQGPNWFNIRDSQLILRIIAKYLLFRPILHPLFIGTAPLPRPQLPPLPSRAPFHTPRWPTSDCNHRRRLSHPFFLLPRYSLASQPHSSSSTSANNQQNIGEIRLKLWYDMDEVHPFVNYQPLYLNLVRSLSVDTHTCSLISLIQCLPIDLENMARPLMKIFVHSKQIRQFFRSICMDYVKSCNDVNTLFRSQSLASKVMYEMMKFFGHNYLVASLKPLVDLIFAERKCCEIDPSKLKTSDSLEQNFRNITTYAELAFDQVVSSLHQCPKALRELFAELRSVVEEVYPNRQDVARLAVSSFLIMRFFAAAILNPKLFALKLETPDVEVSRTLVLVSKILQRISNCVVSVHPLTNKEQWLTPVLQRFSDRDKIAMIQFLDRVSRKEPDEMSQPSEINFVNNENISPVSSSFYETTVLKSGYLIERRCRPVKKSSFKNLIHPKRRFVLLTDASLIWHKNAKDGPASSTSSLMSNSLYSDFNASAEQQKNAKNAFRVTTMNTEVHFQANSETELNEWIILIQKQQRRQLMVLNRSDLNSQVQLQMGAEIDLARELHVIHTNLASHFDKLCDHGWCCRFECTRCDGGKCARDGHTVGMNQRAA